MSKFAFTTLLSSLAFLNTANAGLFCASPMNPDFRVEITIPDLQKSEAMIHEYRFYNLEKNTTKSRIQVKQAQKKTLIFLSDYKIDKKSVRLEISLPNARLVIGNNETLSISCKAL